MSSWISDSRYGRLAEFAAAWLLRVRGYRVVGRNLRVAGRELDVVARRSDPWEAVDARKQERLRFAAALLADADPTVDEVRFDVIAVSGLRVRHLRSAFW
jgi:Holliday junction resolvase-like predicted endonuclease